MLLYLENYVHVIALTYLRMRNFSGKICRENQNTRFMFNNFFHENPALCEIMWNSSVWPDRPEMTK